MLKHIDPLLSPDLLKVLAEMGHGDTLAVVDANFTAATLGRGKPVLRASGVDLARVCAAVLSVLPLDLPGRPVAFMAVCGTAPDHRTALQRDIIALCGAAGQAGPAQCIPLERFAFYEQVRQAYAIVQSGELQPYANFLFAKGVITPAAQPTN